LEEIFDVIAASYSYTYETFINEVTPKLAHRFLELINIRENNAYCYLAMLTGLASNGQDINAYSIKKQKESSVKISDKDFGKMQKEIDKRLRGKINV